MKNKYSNPRILIPALGIFIIFFVLLGVGLLTFLPLLNSKPVYNQKHSQIYKPPVYVHYPHKNKCYGGYDVYQEELKEKDSYDKSKEHFMKKDRDYDHEIKKHDEYEDEHEEYEKEKDKDSSNIWDFLKKLAGKKVTYKSKSKLKVRGGSNTRKCGICQY